MKAPVCRLCCNAHWNNEPHIFSAAQQPPLGNVTAGIVQTGLIKDGPVVTVTTCNQCVTKDAEIARLRNQLAEVGKNNHKAAKRDRAAYMREYRSRS